MMPKDIYFIKAVGLAEIESENESHALSNSYKNTIEKYPEIGTTDFLNYYRRVLYQEINELYNISFTPKFFRINLNYSGLYLGQQVSNILKEKHEEIKKSREAREKYYQEQYDQYTTESSD